MGKRRRDDDGGPSANDGEPTIGQQTSHIANKIVRSEKYAKLRHEKNKLKKRERQKRQKEIERAEELGIAAAKGGAQGKQHRDGAWTVLLVL